MERQRYYTIDLTIGTSQAKIILLVFTRDCTKSGNLIADLKEQSDVFDVGAQHLYY